MFSLCRRSVGFIGIMAFVIAISVSAQDPDNFSEEQKRNFLLNAKVVSSRQSETGITHPYRLTLSNGSVVHDASFQCINERKASMQFKDGQTEVNFRDSYKYNIAAFELAKLVGLDDMMPVTVERKWEGKIGALSWWLPAKMDEKQRMKKHIQPPNPEAWNRQMHKIRVFRQLVYDTDRHNGENMLISENWRLWMIDFSRAFRLYTTLENPKVLAKCDRQLLQRLRDLDAVELERKTRNLLDKMEITGVLGRRDKIVALFDDLIARKGEKEVLY